MSDLFATLPNKPEVRLMPSLIWGGIAGLSVAIIEMIVWQMSAHWINGLAIALCPAGIFFWSAEMEGSTGFLWFVTLVVCVTNFLLWAICACVISAAVQKLLQLSHRQAN